MQRKNQIPNRILGALSPTALVGAVLLTIGLVAIAPQAWACLCQCYYSSDCSGSQYCDYNNCTHQTVNNKLKDGLCKGGTSVSVFEQSTAADGLSLWLQAYAVAGGNGGGAPDAGLVAQATALPLDPQQQEHVRGIALAITQLALGSTSYPDAHHANGGLFSAPLVALPGGGGCGGIAQLDDGSIAALDSVHAGAYGIISDAVVDELRQPGQGFLEGHLARLSVEQPAYETFGVCEFPRIHPGPYRYASGRDCLEAELKTIVYSVLFQPPVNKALDGSLRKLAP